MRDFLCNLFLLTPLREGRLDSIQTALEHTFISTHAPAGGATKRRCWRQSLALSFLLTPLREGRPIRRPLCASSARFLLTPLREGRRKWRRRRNEQENFYSRPCGRGDEFDGKKYTAYEAFLLTPLREGRPLTRRRSRAAIPYFYSRPCGRGDSRRLFSSANTSSISTHAPAGGATFGRNSR